MTATETLAILVEHFGAAVAEEICKAAPGGRIPSPRHLARLIARRKLHAAARAGRLPRGPELRGFLQVPARTAYRWAAERPKR